FATYCSGRRKDACRGVFQRAPPPRNRMVAWGLLSGDDELGAVASRARTYVRARTLAPSQWRGGGSSPDCRICGTRPGGGRSTNRSASLAGDAPVILASSRVGCLYSDCVAEQRKCAGVSKHDPSDPTVVGSGRG